MFKVSEVFNKEINKLQGRKFNAKVIIRDKEYSGNQIYEMNLEESVNPSDSFSIGSICSNSFDIKLINTGDIFDNAIVKPYVGLYIGDDIEYIPLGVFTVIKTSVKGKFINLECVDNMLCLEKVYFSDLSYPADINDIAKEICKKAGVNLATKLPNYRVNKIEGYSLREAIGFIASLCGSFARFNRIGDLEIRGYEVVKQEMTPHNLFKLDIEANECIVKKVIAKKGEEELSIGTDDGNKIVFNNPIITREILSDIYTKYNGFKYIPYTAKWKGNPAILAGDILNLTDLKGNKYNALIMEQKFTYKNGISSEVRAKGKTRQDSSFDSKGSVTQSMERYSIEQANIKKALIDKASINDLTAVDAKIQRLYTDDLTAIKADIVNLNSKKANIIELNSLKATLQQAIIMKADITDLNAVNGKIGILESKTASIDNLLAGNLTANNFKTNSIVAGSGIIADGAIGSAQISSLSVNKLEAGEFITSKHKIVSADGTIEIVGNQILINRNNVNRVVLGEYRKKDGTTEYGLLVRAKDGQTIMLDGNGVHNAGITDGAIDNNKVADNANISGNKLDINSVIREVNTHGTETIAGTRIQVGDRTLDVELSTQKNTITEHGKELSSQKASLTALDNAIKLKVDSQTYTNTINNINGSIATTNSNLSKATTELNLLKGEVNSKVSQSDIDKSISEIKLGGRNYYLNSSFKKTLDSWSTNNPKIIIQDGFLIMDARNITDPYLDTQQTFNVDEEGYYVMSLDVEDANGTCYMYAIDKTNTDAVQPYQDNCFTLQSNKRNFKVVEGRKGTTRFWSVIRAMKGSYLKCRFAKFEKGNKMPTDWTPAPEDVDQLIVNNIKTVTDKITKVESNLTQKTNSIEAGVRDLNNTTQTITTNVMNINRDLTSKINSNLDEAKSFATDIAIAKADLAKEQAIASADGKITDEEQKRIQQAQENLNTAIARADKAKQDAINTASIDATNKANNALNSAKAFVNAEITTVNNKVHNVESNLNILSNEIKSKVSQSDIDKSISAIKIGGRNLILDSRELNNFSNKLKDKIDGFSILSGSANSITSNYIDVASWSGVLSPTPNTEYTLSFYAKGSGSFISYFYPSCVQSGYSNFGAKTSASDGAITHTLTNEWRKYIITWKTVSSVSGNKNVIASRLIKGNNSIQIYGFKFEEGTKATDWTPAPEDTNQLIADSIKVVDTKISDVSSTVTQLKNSVTTEINSINSKTTTLNGKIVNAETRLNSVEAKITDTAIINTVRREFYSKGETDNMYSSKTEVTQLSNSLEWKISTLGAGNLIKNSSFNGGFDCWERFRNPVLSTNTEFLPDRYGKMISIEGDGGIYQRFPTIVGEKYTVSFYAEANQLKPLATTIGIEGINLITLVYEPGFKRWSFTFTATSKEHTFIAYLGQVGKFYLGRVMVTQGTVLQEYREGLGIYSNIAKFDVNGFTVESSSTNTRTITDSSGFRVQDKRTGENLLEANTKGVSARGGRFYVDGLNGNYTLLWGRDININGGRALVGTHSHPEASLQPNKVYLNYNNDFKNGVEIGGKLTNNTFDVLSLISSQKSESGFRKLSDGFMIVWGKVNINIKDGWIIEGTIPFHTKFPNACFLFNANLEKVDNNDYWTANYTLNSYALDKNGGRVYGLNLQKYIGKQGAIAQISYIAIGC